MAGPALFLKSAQEISQSGVAYNNRGIAYWSKGEYDQAIIDFDKAFALNSTTALYPVLWLYLSDERIQARAAKGKLEENLSRARLPTSEWPFPILQLFLGQRSPEETLALATSPDQVCEAQFYVGEWRLLQNERSRAVRALRVAAQVCSMIFPEYSVARAELKRLEQ
jgi:rhomboid protease GluP